MSAQKREADVKQRDFVLGIPGNWKLLRMVEPRAWRYRRRILPKALAKAIGKTEWKSPIFDSFAEACAYAERAEPLHDEIIKQWKLGKPYEPGTESAALIEARARELAAMRPDAQKDAVLDMMAEAFNAWAAAGGKGDFDLRREDRAILTALDSNGRHRPRTMPLSKAYARDVQEYGGKRDEARIKYAVNAFIESVGDLNLFDLRRADVEKWVKLARARGWSDATVKRRSVAIQGIHSRLLIAFDLPASSVWRKLDLTSAGAADDRVPLNTAHLKALDGYLGKKKTKAALALTLMRFTGIGPAELVGLRKRDFVLNHATPHVIVRPHEERGLKTDTRARSIPLVGPALGAAKAAVNAAPSEFVFVKTMTKNAPGSLSALGNKTLRAAGIPKSPRLTCYSLRHGLAEAMRLADVREDQRKYVLGHSQTGVTAKYGASAPLLEELATALAKAHGFLGRVDDSIYEPTELMNDAATAKRKRLAR